MQVAVNANSRRTISRAKLRRKLEQILLTDTELDGFCIDHFPGTYQLFSQGMDRQQKFNLLLVREDQRCIEAQIMARTAVADIPSAPMYIDVENAPFHSSPTGFAKTNGRILVGLTLSALFLFCMLAAISGHGRYGRSPEPTRIPIGSGILRTQPSGAEVWDMRTGRLLGSTPWPIEPSFLPRTVCIRHSGTHDELLALSMTELPDTAVELRPVRSTAAEACDVPIPILP